MSYELLVLERRDNIAVIKLNRPDVLNALSRQLFEEIEAAVTELEGDDDIRAIVFTGAGERAFSAGADIRMLAEETTEFKNNFALFGHETLMRLENTPKLVIAGINGHCVGGGMEIAMACDIRIARKDSGKIGLPEINLGVLAGTGGTARLTRLIGKAKALEYMVSGELIAFEKGVELNLINHLWDGSAANFRQDILDWASQFTLPMKATKAVGNIKRSCQSGPEMPFEYHLAFERELQAALFNSSDAKEGIAAYTERRTPRFTGN